MKGLIALKILLVLAFASCTPSSANVDLVRKSLYDGKVEISIPSTFTIMDEGLKRSKYGRTNSPPEYVFTNEDADINLVLQIKQDEKMLALGLEGTLDEMIKSLKVNNLDRGLIKVNNRDFGYLTFKHKGSDNSVIYNYICFTIVGEDFYFVSFNCTEQHWNRWKDTVKKIMGSIKIE